MFACCKESHPEDKDCARLKTLRSANPTTQAQPPGLSSTVVRAGPSNQGSSASTTSSRTLQGDLSEVDKLEMTLIDEELK